VLIVYQNIKIVSKQMRIVAFGNRLLVLELVTEYLVAI